MKKVLAIGAVLGLAACSSDPQSDMKQAINNAADLNKVCVPYELNLEQLAPQTTPLQALLGSDEVKILQRNEEGKRTNQDAKKQMEHLVRAGLYEELKSEKDKGSKQEIAVYRLTERGTHYLRRSPHGARLCVGWHKAEKVNFYTEPTALRGFTVSQVSYESKIVPEKWAKSLLKDDPHHKDILDNKTTRYATLVKTNDGWRDIRELNQ